ncbi:MAG: hypothetical protein A2479_04660 [Candidatus Magasanikbacteria bacterium RIFOXYC2_FULL_39_8]|nr:MAG: hypothetical protein A2479_04660 [Candidatus Magasanikbacteria bacterium RIFOXYC2_FULL_39_8]
MKILCSAKTIIAIIIMASFFAGSFVYTQDAPYIANYYLNAISDGNAADFARYDVLILTPAQIAARQSTIDSIKKQNPDIIILAYIPSQSYNYTYWSSDNVFRHMNVDNTWWLRDSSGRQVSTWDGIYNINMDHAWSKYLVEFCNTYIMSLSHVDGIFFDMISENISWANGGNIDLNNDGQKDIPSEADPLWRERTQYLLKYAQDHLNTDYIIMNGSSHTDFQQYVNGRMFETFPTPWEGDGSWSTIMNNVVRIKKDNKKPQIIIFNSNTNNNGNNDDYKKMRFGITSSLLENNIYFSFDHGDTDHGQTWWYDEYDVDLGEPIAPATSQQSYTTYKEDVWKRNFEHGVSIVNSTNQAKVLDLGGEYEKIHGTQDEGINDGSIVSEVMVPGKDGLILLKTFETLSDVLFTNGSFLRFFRPDSSRVRNGFFVFEDGQKGGYQVAHTDLDANGKRELIVVKHNRIQVWRDDGQLYMNVYPYGAQYEGSLHVALGDLDGDQNLELYVAPSEGYKEPIRVYSRHGRKVRHDFYPFGEQYNGGYSLAVGDIDNGGISRRNYLFVGALSGGSSVSIYNYSFEQQHHFNAFESTFYGGVHIAAGDVDGDGVDEVIIGKGKGGAPIIKIFDASGKEKYSAFTAYSSFGNPGIDVRAVDVDFDGKDDIIGMSEGAF